MINHSKFKKIQKAVIKLLGKQNVLTNKTALLLHSFDGSPVKSLPDAVLEIKDISKLSPLLKILYENNIPFTPRAAGTNHDGGTIALKGGCILNLNHLDKIEQTDTQNKTATLQCGVINADLQKELKEKGFFYAPDPASKEFSTIGGNAALGAGGPKTLKYGATLANILKADFVLPDGTTITLDKDENGPDLTDLLLKSEGTLGLITRLTVKIYPLTFGKRTVLAYFPSLSNAMQSVKEITAKGIIPSALEAMDKATLNAVQAQQTAEAFLIIELEGKNNETEKQIKTVLEICSNNKAFNLQSAQDEEQSKAFWQKRFSAAAAIASLGSGLISLDCAVNRSDLPQAIEDIMQIYKKYNLRAGTVFHAGDGNIHPNIVFNENNSFELSSIKQAVKEIHKTVCKYKGTISAEHGIGVEKRAAMALMYDNETLDLFRKIKTAIDPKNLANPDKVLPISSIPQKITQIPPEVKPFIERIKQANKSHTPLEICGLNSKIKLKTKQKLSVKELNKITEIDTVNYTATVQAGVSLKDLREALLKHNLYLPVNLGKANASIGGEFCSKTNPELKNFITGIDFITPQGNFIQYGGKYLKNTAGYDLISLLCGSHGAYGLITSLTLRILPFKPQNRPLKDFKPVYANPLQCLIKHALDPDNILNPSFLREEK